MQIPKMGLEQNQKEDQGLYTVQKQKKEVYRQ